MSHADRPALGGFIERARGRDPIRVAVVDAGQALVAETVRDACELGFVSPILLGQRGAVEAACAAAGWVPPAGAIVESESDPESAARAVALVRGGDADVIMKGQVHTDVLMQAVLDRERGLRTPARRVSHVFVVEIPARGGLLGITDAAINISPDLAAKSQILRNAMGLFRLLGVPRPKVAVLSAIETVDPAIPSSVDAACLTLMARRGQVEGADVDGPLAFDNAISARAAKEKGIDSTVAGDADIVLVPDLVSGNILAKSLEYLAGAVAAGVVVGLTAPMVLSSRADPPEARLAALAVAALMVHDGRERQPPRAPEVSSTLRCAPQPEHACCPLPA